jgi:hypothetical protein
MIEGESAPASNIGGAHPGSGAPNGNGNARKHGLNTMRDALTTLGSRACVAADDYKQTDDGSLFVGVDLVTKHDSAAVVSVAWTQQGAIKLVSHRIWQPSPQNPLDLENTIEWHLRELHSQGQWANGQRKPVTVQLRDPRSNGILGNYGR